MAHGSCASCGRAFRTKQARIIAERRAAVILDLKGIKPAEHLRPINYAIDQSEAQAKAARVAKYKQTGELEAA